MQPRRSTPRSQPDADAGVEGLAEVENLYKLLVESVRDYAIFVLDTGGHILTWNPGAERFNGYTADEVAGKHFSIFYPEEDTAWDKPGWELDMATLHGRFEDEGWRIRKDGSRFWSNVVITALRDPAGRLVGFAKVTRDLTERKAAEERAVEDARRLAAEETARRVAEERAQELSDVLARLREAVEELEHRRREAEEANRAKSDFLAAMSHELRTPLNAIGGYVELLRMGIRGPVNEAQDEDLRRIAHSQQHLLAVINDILNFSRIEAGRVSYEIRPTRLREVLDAVEQMISVSAAAKGLEFERGEPPDVVVRADLAKAEQILLNLLSNAVKFTEPGGRVTLEAEVGDTDVRVTVRDTGRGIPPDHLDAVFEPFVQVGRSLDRPSEGTGLGLAISRDLARGMGGDLTAESEEGVGSAFTLTLQRG